MDNVLPSDHHFILKPGQWLTSEWLGEKKTKIKTKSNVAWPWKAIHDQKHTSVAESG